MGADHRPFKGKRWTRRARSGISTARRRGMSMTMGMAKPVQWMKRAILGIALVAQAGPVFAQAILVHMTGPKGARIKPGAIIHPGMTFEKDEQVTLLLRSGTLVFKGPVVLTRELIAGVGLKKTPSGLRIDKPKRVPRVATVRSMTAPPAPPNIWSLTLGDNGPHCLLNDMAPVLTRRDSRAEASLRIHRGEITPAPAFPWRAGKRDFDWPAEIPALGSYRISTGTYASEISFVRLDALPDTLPALKALLNAKGCQNQSARI
jgi:hypothetical protein